MLILRDINGAVALDIPITIKYNYFKYRTQLVRTPCRQ